MNTGIHAPTIYGGAVDANDTDGTTHVGAHPRPLAVLTAYAIVFQEKEKFLFDKPHLSDYHIMLFNPFSKYRCGKHVQG